MEENNKIKITLTTSKITKDKFKPNLSTNKGSYSKNNKFNGLNTSFVYRKEKTKLNEGEIRKKK